MRRFQVWSDQRHDDGCCCITVLPGDKALEELLKQARMLCLSRSCFVACSYEAALMKYFSLSPSLSLSFFLVFASPFHIIFPISSSCFPSLLCISLCPLSLSLPLQLLIASRVPAMIVAYVSLRFVEAAAKPFPSKIVKEFCFAATIFFLIKLSNCCLRLITSYTRFCLSVLFLTLCLSLKSSGFRSFMLLLLLSMLLQLLSIYLDKTAAIHSFQLGICVRSSSVWSVSH